MSLYEAYGATAEAADCRVLITLEAADRELQRAFIDLGEAEALIVRLQRAVQEAARKPAMEREALEDTTYQVTFGATLAMEVTGEQLVPYALREEIVEAYDTGDMTELCEALWRAGADLDAGFGPHALDVNLLEVDMEVV